ncbi:hypothetical protein JVU11DRAFT_11396 [Chiua virens]|nr:hypothetical protein JVU11DRAFT_11396 [Chiua virens]
MHPREGAPVAMSLLEFNNLFIDLDSRRGNDERAEAEAREHALTLGLNGIHVPAHRRIIIEPLRNRLHRPYALNISRDFDSLIAFTDELPVTHDLYIYRVFHSTMTLTKSVHVKVRMHTQPGQPSQLVHPHKIPNVCIAQIGARHCVRLFFPALAQAAEGHSELSEDQLAAVYDRGLYPAICHLTPELATNWSTSYITAKLRARNLNGTYQMGTHPFPGDTAHRLGSMIKRNLQDALPWARGCLWMVQIQGVKEAHTHTPADFLASRASFEMLMNGLMRGLIRRGQSWVDVGLQISEANHVLQWRTDSHHHLAKEFSDLAQDAAARLCILPSRSYSRDYVAGLVDLSGFRATLNPNNSNTGAAYIQAYTTDKALIAHLEAGRHGLFMRGKDALQGDGDGHTPPYCRRMMAIYEGGVRHTTAARVEARIPVTLANNTMLDFPEVLLERTLCRFPAVDWWQWRQIRMSCIAETLALQNSAHPSLRYLRETLNLTAALVWLANGLNSRPDDDQYGRDVMVTSCWTADDLDHGTFLIHPPAGGPVRDLPVVRQGAIFLRGILFPPTSGVPRFSYGKELNNATWIHFFSRTPDQLRLQALPPPFIPRQRVLEAGRIPTQKRMSRLHGGQVDEALPELANLEFRIPPIPRDVAEDLPYEEQVEYGVGDMAQNLPVQLTHLWQQFLSDVMQKCGNLRGAIANASHCRLSTQERQNITQQALTHPNLATIFRRVQYRASARQEWADAFSHYFSPLDGKIPIQPQNFPNMLYWRRWAELKSLLPAAVGNMRRQLRLLFDQLAWVPEPASDRVWRYQRDDRFCMLPPDWTSNAPQILMNPSSGQPQWSPPLVDGEQDGMEDVIPRQRPRGPQPIPYLHLRQEEEDSSD